MTYDVQLGGCNVHTILSSHLFLVDVYRSHVLLNEWNAAYRHRCNFSSRYGGLELISFSYSSQLFRYNNVI